MFNTFVCFCLPAGERFSLPVLTFGSQRFVLFEGFGPYTAVITSEVTPAFTTSPKDFSRPVMSIV